MPQTLSDQWKKDLGPEWERIHQTYLHTMANLTLTVYNSQYSNLTFLEKRDMEKGFKESAFRLNNYVKFCDKWTEDELKERQKELLGVFMRLWPMPSTTFKPTEQEAESASLEDDDSEFTGKKLQVYILYGVRYTVNTWKDMLIQVCNHILLKKCSIVEWLCANEKSGFSTTPESWRRELGSNMYLWTDNSTQTKINILHGLFEECNIPYIRLLANLSDEILLYEYIGHGGEYRPDGIKRREGGCIPLYLFERYYGLSNRFYIRNHGLRYAICPICWARLTTGQYVMAFMTFTLPTVCL